MALPMGSRCVLPACWPIEDLGSGTRHTFCGIPPSLRSTISAGSAVAVRVGVDGRIVARAAVEAA